MNSESTEQSKFVLIGKVHSPQGIRGEIFVSIFSGEAAWYEQWDTLYLSSDSEDAPTSEMKIIKSREHQKQGRWGFAVSTEEVKDRNRAETMKGYKVYIPESFLISEEGEGLYLREVLGFRVIDKTRGDVGEVIGFSGNSMQDILVIEGAKGHFEVPFVEPILMETDKDNRLLQMDIPLGLVAGETL